MDDEKVGRSQVVEGIGSSIDAVESGLPPAGTLEGGLAVAMAGSLTKSGKVKALNGYKYLSKAEKGSLIPLSELRRRALYRRRDDEGQQRILRLLMASGKPLMLCPLCKKEEHEDQVQQISTNDDSFTLVTLTWAHPCSSRRD